MLLNQPENEIELRYVIVSSQGEVHIKCEIILNIWGLMSADFQNSVYDKQ